jgi:hypothetical protein
VRIITIRPRCECVLIEPAFQLISNIVGRMRTLTAPDFGRLRYIVGKIIGMQRVSPSLFVSWINTLFSLGVSSGGARGGQGGEIPPPPNYPPPIFPPQKNLLVTESD